MNKAGFYTLDYECSCTFKTTKTNYTFIRILECPYRLVLMIKEQNIHIVLITDIQTHIFTFNSKRKKEDERNFYQKVFYEHHIKKNSFHNCFWPR